ncbi:hypothetical protein V1478_004778 [Vespula squamosa]|uniref:Uncharacterized protein n=1 Tax=Vespula squamosa TaxID=30214 RepID=A0ABD2BER4_VESSQ
MERYFYSLEESLVVAEVEIREGEEATFPATESTRTRRDLAPDASFAAQASDWSAKRREKEEVGAEGGGRGGGGGGGGGGKRSGHGVPGMPACRPGD